MKYLEGIDYDTWWAGLDLPVRRDLEAARRAEALDRRKSEVRDYQVTVSWLETAPDQAGEHGDGPVCYAVIHPRGGAGFQCQAEADLFAIEAETGHTSPTVIVGVTKRVRWKDGDKLRLGTNAGIPADDARIVHPSAFRAMLEQARQRMGRTVE